MSCRHDHCISDARGGGGKVWFAQFCFYVRVVLRRLGGFVRRYHRANDDAGSAALCLQHLHRLADRSGGSCLSARGPLALVAGPFVWTSKCRAKQAVGLALELRDRFAGNLAGNVSASSHSPSASASVLSPQLVRRTIS